MTFENGLVGHSWSCLRETWFSEFASRLTEVDYNNLVQRPAAILDELYDALNKPPLDHDFKNVDYEAADLETIVGMPGVHKAPRKVECKEKGLLPTSGPLREACRSPVLEIPRDAA